MPLEKLDNLPSLLLKKRMSLHPVVLQCFYLAQHGQVKILMVIFGSMNLRVRIILFSQTEKVIKQKERGNMAIMLLFLCRSMMDK